MAVSVFEFNQVNGKGEPVFPPYKATRSIAVPGTLALGHDTAAFIAVTDANAVRWTADGQAPGATDLPIFSGGTVQTQVSTPFTITFAAG